MNFFGAWEKEKKRLNFVVVVAVAVVVVVAVAVVGPKNNSSSFSLPFSVFFYKNSFGDFTWYKFCFL